jgi:aspartate/methionine/tyrosine aminotransferase
MSHSPVPSARPLVQTLSASKIRELANAGFGQADVLRFWFGESDRVTPDYIRNAAVTALTDGRTFYTHNNGNAELRAAVAGYLTGLHDRPFDTPQITITSSGVSALMIAMQAILDPGDRVVAIAPVWPNVTEIPRILGAHVVRCALTPTRDEWRLDLDALLAAITPQTKLVLLNSPGNPTGWTLPGDQRKVILDHCRRLGVWLLCDEVYERLTLAPELTHAPSFLAIAEPDDRIIGVNSFSKAWLMTGWRLGWIVAPAGMELDLGKLVEYNTSCAPDFIQAGGLAAIRQGEPHIAQLRTDLIARRNGLLHALRQHDRIEAPVPAGGMYAFFRIAGCDDSVTLARTLLASAGLGLAPGAAFGPEGEGWLRWCFAVEASLLDQGIERLAGWLGDPRR